MILITVIFLYFSLNGLSNSLMTSAFSDLRGSLVVCAHTRVTLNGLANSHKKMSLKLSLKSNRKDLPDAEDLIRG